MPIIPIQREAKYYRDASGRMPVQEFLSRLKDPVGRLKIYGKILKAEKGNFGVEGVGYRHLRGAIWELKVSHGPGYRVYFALTSQKIILLLAAGSKVTQELDIKKAEKYLNHYLTLENI